MAPDASRLVYRIKTALKGESSGQETAKLAYHYSDAVKEANRRIDQSLKALETDRILDAFIPANLGNRLLDTVDSLDFAEKNSWKERCGNFGWPVAPDLDHEGAGRLKEAFAKQSDLKNWLYGEYRTTVRSKQKLSSYSIIRVLHDYIEGDQDIANEHQRVKEQLLESISSEIESALQELMPGESASAVLERYRSHGLELPTDSKVIQQAIDAERSLLTNEATEKVSKIVERSEEATDSALWKGLESDYLSCDAFLAKTNLRANINAELREKFNDVGTALSRSRGSYESNILIRSAIDELQAKLKPGRGKLGPSKINYREAAERLISRQTQSRKLGYPIPTQLQEEIKKILSEAKHRRAKRIGLLGLASIAACAIIVWIGAGILSQSEETIRIGSAITALNSQGNRSSIEIAQSTLRTWNSLIASQDSDHPLSKAASDLRDWIDRQTAFAESYSKIVDELASLKSSGYQTDSEKLSKPILDRVEGLRNQLIESEGSEADQRIQEFRTWLADSKARAIHSQERATAVLEGEIRNGIEAAKAAKSAEDFTAAAQAVSKSIEDAAARGFATQFAALVMEAESELASIEAKWIAVGSMISRLGDSKSLSDYLSQLSRIQSFDNVSQADRRLMQRILQALPSTDRIKQQLILPDAANGWMELSSENDYRRAQPMLNDVERVFLQRLANDPVFSNVYESKVKYFEGEPIAKSEYSVFLVDPISQSQTGLKTGINFSFSVRGFDEFGEPEEEAREMNFLSHPDGSFWGFFYEPSELSEESEYYEKSIRVALLQILDGAPRFSALNLFEQLNQQPALSYAFRAYWQSQLSTFIQMNPWKWGSAVAPSLKKQIKNLESLPQSSASKRQWLSSIEQNSPSVSLTEYFRIGSKYSLTDEAVAFARLYQNLKDGKIKLIGISNAEGSVTLNTNVSRDHTLFTVDRLTGRITALKNSSKPAAYAPIFTLSIDDGPARIAIKNTEIATGFNLSNDTYKEHLPPVLR